jgi:hypothetical protein
MLCYNIYETESRNNPAFLCLIDSLAGQFSDCIAIIEKSDADKRSSYRFNKPGFIDFPPADNLYMIVSVSVIAKAKAGGVGADRVILQIHHQIRRIF